MTTGTLTYIHLVDGSLMTAGAFSEADTKQAAPAAFVRRCAEYGWYLTPGELNELRRSEEGDTSPELVSAIVRQVQDALTFLEWLTFRQAEFTFGDTTCTVAPKEGT